MIVGFNTDVKFRDEMFHIQTEDKGQDNPENNHAHPGNEQIVAFSSGLKQHRPIDVRDK